MKTNKYYEPDNLLSLMFFEILSKNAFTYAYLVSQPKPLLTYF